MAANGSKFKGKKGNAVCMVEFDENKEKILNIKAAVIDGEIFKKNTWFTFENGEFIEVK